jgi:hypothetical protein
MLNQGKVVREGKKDSYKGLSSWPRKGAMCGDKGSELRREATGKATDGPAGRQRRART